MIGKLTGVFAGRQGESVVIDVQGVGYCVRAPGVWDMHEGTHISLHIHTAVRDDAIDLYGFLQEAELVFFRQLMTVSSIGPKTALTIMGVAELSALQRAIGSGDALTLTKVFGIGKKSAERIVVELRDKLNIETSTQQFSENSSNHAEVIEALMALGYSAAECRNALTHMENTGDSLKEKIGAALKQLGSPLSRNKGNSFTV